LSLQVLFLREHNRVARYLCQKHNDWDDSKLYHSARKYVIATIQRITFEEYLYWLLARPFPEPDFYDQDIDPRIHIFFSTVAFRYGHSEIGDIVKRARQGQFGQFPQWQYSKLWKHYSDPYFDINYGIYSVWQGMASQLQQSSDLFFSDTIRNQLFQGYSKRPLYDLMAMDIQRSRDHGIPSCNDARIAYGLPSIDNWDDFYFMDKANGQNEQQVQGRVSSVYQNPWEADSFVCGLAEKWVTSQYSQQHGDYSNLGKLFEAAVISQFQRTRIGDRFWYLRNLDEVHCYGELPDMTSRTLADVIRDNCMEEISIPDEVFRVSW